MAAFLSYVGNVVAGYIALTLFFYLLSVVIPKAAFVARSLAAYLSLIVCSLYGVVASIVLRLTGYHQLSQWTVARSFKYTMRLTTGVTFEVQDPHGHLDNIRPAVFIGNHQTELDVLMLGCMFPKYCSVTAKSSLKKTPFLGWFMSLSGSIFINRSNTHDAREAMRGAADEIRNKRQSVYMFPEGTRSYAKEPMLLPFKKGAFHLAVQAQVPIVPVVVANYSHIFWIKGLVFKSGRIPCKGGCCPVPSPFDCWLTAPTRSPRPDSHDRPYRRRCRRADEVHPRADAQGAHRLDEEGAWAACHPREWPVKRGRQSHERRDEGLFLASPSSM
ncbi:uncharacterized protein THITE_2120080 [Thermothielavioides terrestris NRRL 8126]|jgi:lysophosphatidate acyltransferase|uniref:1-acyl-sn-glycerol-3-phosphate acyltransferase n=1 Tax=Thermothielavioides terrestris (strain ATCC 38088 / NRRL 8126) TaxID=578455 RepID=G2R9J2_THETT|nr:uncharacterized protein THITE_2120080 [Thermothielavioides terrestris NRRL 8126]AEO69536.1 hypothetical protein THITE_2120080 [Thermothielavioides terrestris NRRL 8126]